MTHYLKQVDIEAYGAFANREVGPFSEGLNVVFGPNEAGKSTIVSFIGGVLFGWEEARGVRNTYRPAGRGRAGSLAFSNGEGATSELVRAHNADGLAGDSSLVADIDSSTFRTMFWLTSDELRSLRNTSDVTARLLTAGSGTGLSPAAAFVELEQRIAARTARAGESEESIAHLDNLLERKLEEVRAAAGKAELHRQEDRELQELASSRKVAAGHVDALNHELEEATAWCASIESIDERMASCQAELSNLKRELSELASESGVATGIDERLLDLDAASDRALRDKVDEHADAQERAARAVDLAKENSSTSTAAYEAFLEMGEGDAVSASYRRGRRQQAIVSVLFPIVFVLAGIPLFIHGRQIGSLSFTALGVGLVILAFVLAAATLVVLLRPDKGAEAIEARKTDAQWIMLQDKKKLDACLVEKDRVDAEIAAFLDEAGLANANGSLRQARLILDDAREARAQREVVRQKSASLDLRTGSAEASLAELSGERCRIMGLAELAPDAPVSTLDDLIRQKSAQRDALLEALESMNQRSGELSRELDRASDDREFDRLKLEYQQIKTRLRARKHELVELLLAKRMLERSIAAWESHSQPEVYACASKLFSLITDGAWVQISMSPEGRMVAVDAAGNLREPRHLSLGTCQQLYLSLRIAMLLTAENVGKAIPVLADDILVNFDGARRAGAARALAELAAHRQVIVFTCHEETVTALRAADPDLNLLSL